MPGYFWRHIVMLLGTIRRALTQESTTTVDALRGDVEPLQLLVSVEILGPMIQRRRRVLIVGGVEAHLRHDVHNLLNLSSRWTSGSRTDKWLSKEDETAARSPSRLQ